MNKIRYIARLITAFVLFLASIGILVATIYTFTDYSYNDFLNVYLGDIDILLMILLIVVFMTCSILLFVNTIKKVKNVKNTEKV